MTASSRDDKNSATPRTDALMDPTSPIGFKGQAMVELARQLERDLAVVTEQANGLFMGSFAKSQELAARSSTPTNDMQLWQGPWNDGPAPYYKIPCADYHRLQQKIKDEEKLRESWREQASIWQQRSTPSAIEASTEFTAWLDTYKQGVVFDHGDMAACWYAAQRAARSSTRPNHFAALEKRGLYMPPGILVRLIKVANCTPREQVYPDDARYLVGVLQELTFSKSLAGPSETPPSAIAPNGVPYRDMWAGGTGPLVTDAMVNRFLSWKLPASVRPDECVLDQSYPHRIGTNLLTADEARQMLEHVLRRADDTGQKP